MLRYGYFDSDIIGVDDEGMPIFDRAELSDLFALLLASLVSDGVLALPSTCFKVQAAGNGLAIERLPGFGMIKGHFCYDDEPDIMELDPAPQTYSRIDLVVMRLNLLERVVEIIIKKGEEAASPKAPELARPSAGDYFELCLARVTLAAKQATVTQSSISDTRANSAVCGFITQLIDHLDTKVFYEQLDAFYKEFVDKSNTSYEQFEQMARDAYRKFTDDITGYIASLKQDSTDAYNRLVDAMDTFYQELSDQGRGLHDQYSAEIAGFVSQLEEKGNRDLAEITQQLLDFRNTNETEFLEWFERIKGIFGTDPGGNIQNQLDGLASRLSDLSEMLYTGMVTAKLATEAGNFISDDLGRPILAEWPICKCHS